VKIRPNAVRVVDVVVVEVASRVHVEHVRITTIEVVRRQGPKRHPSYNGIDLS
jgi:hypothetical protein